MTGGTGRERLFDNFERKAAKPQQAETGFSA